LILQRPPAGPTAPRTAALIYEDARLYLITVCSSGVLCQSLPATWHSTPPKTACPPPNSSAFSNRLPARSPPGPPGFLALTADIARTSDEEASARRPIPFPGRTDDPSTSPPRRLPTRPQDPEATPMIGEDVLAPSAENDQLRQQLLQAQRLSSVGALA